ncbi:MAG: efflux RND transporter periplasmic adaptor subunit [Clostridium sp.]|nr:efflux RND transporter periplasmic adaptor subunit [Clostridium sp.]
MNVLLDICRIGLAAALLATASCAGLQSGSDTGSEPRDSVTAAPADKITEVTVAELTPRTFSHEIVANGRIGAREKADLRFQTQGLVSAIYVRNGQHVAKGTKIATQDAYKLQNQLEKDRNAVASARLELQDVIIGQGYDPEHLETVPAEVMRLARIKSGLQQAELAVAATERELAEATLVAPIGGTVVNLKTKPNNMSPASDPFCSIINEAGMDVEFSVLESELPMVAPGDRVSVAPFSGGESRPGTVTEINRMVDDNGMVRVMATVSGGGGLIDGMNVRVRIKRAVEEALVVPKTAVVLRSGRQVVFTLDGNRAMWNYVTTGLENLDEYTIVEGLEPGVTVITSGNVNLAHESPVVMADK